MAWLVAIDLMRLVAGEESDKSGFIRNCRRNGKGYRAGVGGGWKRIGRGRGVGVGLGVGVGVAVGVGEGVTAGPSCTSKEPMSTRSFLWR